MVDSFLPEENPFDEEYFEDNPFTFKNTISFEDPTRIFILH